jgi:hypothetical protein
MSSIVAQLTLLDVGLSALGKGFIGCCHNTRQRKGTVVVLAVLTVALPNANHLGTRQRFFVFFQKFFADCQPFWCLAKKISFSFENALPSAYM